MHQAMTMTMMMDLTPQQEHEYVLLGDMLCFVDTLAERQDVAELLAEVGIDSAPCYVGTGSRDDIRDGCHTARLEGGCICAKGKG